MAVPEQEARWINREDEGFDYVYRVEVPGEGGFLVRANEAHRATERAVEELGYGVVDELVERCEVTPAHDVVDVPGLRVIDVYTRWQDAGDGEYEAGWYGPAFRAGVIGFSDDSAHEAVENLVVALAGMGVAGHVRVVTPFEPEPIPLGDWRRRAEISNDPDAADTVKGARSDDQEVL